MKLPVGIRKLLKYTAWVVVIGILSVILIHGWVSQKTSSYTYSDISELPANKVGLVLGTSKYVKNGRPNYYFQYRMDAAEALYRAGKVEYLLISGDNSHVSYNEPIAMQKDLIARGIPKEKIYLDYAGFRTFDSVIRAWKIFGQTKFTVISQPFHNQRAVFIARKEGLDVIAFDAEDVGVIGGLRTQIRERLARVKMLIDLYITKEEPRFLGDPVVIPN